MLWLAVPVAIGGAAGALYAYFSEKAGESRRQWESKRQELHLTIEDHRARIQQHIQKARTSADFHFLADLHHSSHLVADEAYKQYRNSKKCLSAMHDMANQAYEKKEEYKKKLDAKPEPSKEHREEILGEINRLNDLRFTTYDEIEKLEEERNHFLSKVKSLNKQTRRLKLAIRDRCGRKGRDWYERLEARTRRRDQKKMN